MSALPSDFSGLPPVWYFSRTVLPWASEARLSTVWPLAPYRELTSGSPGGMVPAVAMIRASILWFCFCWHLGSCCCVAVLCAALRGPCSSLYHLVVILYSTSSEMAQGKCTTQTDFSLAPSSPSKDGEPHKVALNDHRVLSCQHPACVHIAEAYFLHCLCVWGWFLGAQTCVNNTKEEDGVPLFPVQSHPPSFTVLLRWLTVGLSNPFPPTTHRVMVLTFPFQTQSHFRKL